MIRPLPALLSAIAGLGQYPALRQIATLRILGTGNEGRQRGHRDVRTDERLAGQDDYPRERSLRP